MFRAHVGPAAATFQPQRGSMERGPSGCRGRQPQCVATSHPPPPPASYGTPSRRRRHHLLLTALHSLRSAIRRHCIAHRPKFLPRTTPFVGPQPSSRFAFVSRHASTIDASPDAPADAWQGKAPGASSSSRLDPKPPRPGVQPLPVRPLVTPPPPPLPPPPPFPPSLPPSPPSPPGPVAAAFDATAHAAASLAGCPLRRRPHGRRRRRRRGPARA